MYGGNGYLKVGLFCFLGLYFMLYMTLMLNLIVVNENWELGWADCLAALVWHCVAPTCAYHVRYRGCNVPIDRLLDLDMKNQ